MDLSDNPRLLTLHKVFLLQLNKIIMELGPKNIYRLLKNVPINVISKISVPLEENRRMLATTLYNNFEKFLLENDIPQLCKAYEEEAVHAEILKSTNLDREAQAVLKRVFKGHGANYPYSRTELQKFVQQAKSEIPRLEEENRQLRDTLNDLIRRVQESQRNLLMVINN